MSVSLRKSNDVEFLAWSMNFNRAQREGVIARTQRVELLGNTSVGRIVRPEFGGQSIAKGTLKPLTAFYSD